MKIDDIISALKKHRDNKRKMDKIDASDLRHVIDMLIELAEHVKAQEPEPLTEEDVLNNKMIADRIDGYDRDDLGESPNY